MSKQEKDSANKALFKLIKSKYILKQVLALVEEVKLLELVRYNKKYRKLIHKNINDYKDHYFTIIIEVIPAENRYGSFINIDPRYRSHFRFLFQ